MVLSCAASTVTCCNSSALPIAVSKLGQTRVAQWSLTTLREKLVKIGARIVRQRRYVVFQLAEVAVPRSVFVAILRRMDRLRGPPVAVA